MTAQEIIEKIRTEIEHHKELFKEACDVGSYYACSRRDEANAILEALSDLEKECEKPMEHKDIDTEIGHWLDSLDDKYCMLVPHYSIEDIKDTARYFAKWGAEHLRDTTKETDVLEKVKDLTHEVRVAYERGIEVGRKEQKEQMMKDGLDKIVHLEWGKKKIEIYDEELVGLKFGDEVKLIIIK